MRLLFDGPSASGTKKLSPGLSCSRGSFGWFLRGTYRPLGPVDVLSVGIGIDESTGIVIVLM